MKLAPIFRAVCALIGVLLLAGCGLDLADSTSKGDGYESSVEQADQARQAGNFDSAIPLYARALQMKPDGTDAKLGLGQSFLSVGAPDEAAALFRDVLAQRSSNQVARRGLASALISMGQPDLAARQLEAALQADPRDYRSLNALGVVLDMQGRHLEAQEKYRQGIAVAPDYLALRNNFALSLAISGNPQEAIALLVPIANTRAADGRVRQNLAFSYAMAGDLENALQVSRKELDEASAQRQLSYFMQLKALPPEARSAELRRNPSFFPQSGGGNQGAGRGG